MTAIKKKNPITEVNSHLSGLAGGLRGISCKCLRKIASIAVKVGLLDGLNCRHSPIIFHNSLGIPTPTTLAYCGGCLRALTTARYISSALKPAHLQDKYQQLLTSNKLVVLFTRYDKSYSTYGTVPVHISTNVHPKLQASDSTDMPIASSQKRFNDFFTGSHASGAV